MSMNAITRLGCTAIGVLLGVGTTAAFADDPVQAPDEPLPLTHAEGLPAPPVSAVAVLPDGRVAIGTFYGLALWDGQEMQVFPKMSRRREALQVGEPMPDPGPDRLPAGVDHLLIDDQGRLWIGTLRGLAWLEDGELKHVTDRLPELIPPLPPPERWHEMEPDEVERIMDRYMFRMMQHSITPMLHRHDGEVWLGTSVGAIIAYAPGNDAFRFIHEPDEADQRLIEPPDGDGRGGAPPAVTALVETPDGDVLAGMLGKGLVGISERGLETADLPEQWLALPALNVPVVPALATDRDGALWLATAQGVARVTADGQRDHFTVGDGYVDAPAKRLDVDPQGQVWVITPRGIAVYDNGRWRYPQFGVEDVEWGFGVQHTADGNRWVSYRDGVVRNPEVRWHDERRTTRLRQQRQEDVGRNWPELPEDELVGRDSRGKAWMGVNGQLLVYDGDAWVDKSDRIERGEVQFIKSDSKERLWIGTSGRGAMMIDGEDIERFNDTPGHARSVIYAMAEDGEGTLYFGTQHGLYRFADGHWDHLLDRYQAHPLAVDDHDRVWFADVNWGLILYDDGQERQLTAEHAELEGRIVNQITPLEDGRVRVKTVRREALHDVVVFEADGKELTPMDE